jgi:HD-like signal output (HDOD) protein/CheY-like chemotaxis protein
MKRRILFVDDEPLVLQGLQRMLRGLRDEWDMQFVSSGPEALEAMAGQPADVVVSDIRMPGMNGAELLQEVARRHPAAIRMVLSGDAHPEHVLQCVNIAHQFLAKPCDAFTLKQALDRVFALENRLRDATMRCFVSGLSALPSVPSVYQELREKLASPEASVESVGETLQRDPAMTLKLLQLVNSASFGLGRQVTHPTQAAMLLGLETIKTLTLWLHVFKNGPKIQVPGFSLDELARASLQAGQLARALVREERGSRAMQETAFTGGLLSDIGQLVLAVSDPGTFTQARQLAEREGLQFWQAELQLRGFTHADVGAYLLGLWGLPFDLVEAVAFHHDPSPCVVRGFSAVTALHAAVALQAHRGSAPVRGLDPEYLKHANLEGHVESWRDVAAETLSGQPVC